MGSLPWAALLGEIASIEGALYTTQAHFDPSVLERIVYMFCAPPSSHTLLND
jgi:hypothetical protein